MNETFASIDIGTNTVLLLIADTDGDSLKPLRTEQRIPRLGQGVDAGRNLNGGAMNRVLQVLVEYRQIIGEYAVESTVVTATSAVRDAANRDLFINEVRKKTGFELKVLPGEQEARFTWAGALAGLSGIRYNELVSVLDIGGGSTEIATGTGRTLQTGFSLDMGAVRFTERFFSFGYSQQAIAKAESAAEELLKKAGKSSLGRMIGVAGTVTSLAFMELGLRTFDVKRIDGSSISLNAVDNWKSYCFETDQNELLSRFPLVMEGRADIFPAGLLILSSVMRYFSIDALTVSCGGIREGSVLMRKNGAI